MNIINEQIRAFLEEPDMIAALSNISAVISMSYDRLNWAGFYFAKNGELVLGPFQGKPACTHIPFDRGVCGKTYRTMETQLVDDVLAAEDHIACDSASRSELCVPVISDGKCIMEIDIDSPVPCRFDEAMKKEMEQAAEDISAAYRLHLWKI